MGQDPIETLRTLLTLQDLILKLKINPPGIPGLRHYCVQPYQLPDCGKPKCLCRFGRGEQARSANDRSWHATPAHLSGYHMFPSKKPMQICSELRLSGQLLAGCRSTLYVHPRTRWDDSRSNLFPFTTPGCDILLTLILLFRLSPTNHKITVDGRHGMHPPERWALTFTLDVTSPCAGAGRVHVGHRLATTKPRPTPCTFSRMLPHHRPLSSRTLSARADQPLPRRIPPLKARDVESRQESVEATT